MPAWAIINGSHVNLGRCCSTRPLSLFWGRFVDSEGLLTVALPASLRWTSTAQIGHVFPVSDSETRMFSACIPFAELLDLMRQGLGISHGRIPDVEIF